MQLLVLALVCTLGTVTARPRVPSKSSEFYVPEYAEDKAVPQETSIYEYEPSVEPTQYNGASRDHLYDQTARDQGSVDQPYDGPTFVPILKDLRQSPEKGVHNMAIETGNGIKVLQQVAGNEEGSRTKGAYFFTHPDGTVHKVTYIADENGFRPSSDLLPVAPVNPHPMPAHALAQIEKARLEKERRKAQGLSEQYEGREPEYDHYESDYQYEGQYEQPPQSEYYEGQYEGQYDQPSQNEYEQYERQESNQQYEVQGDVVFDEDPEQPYILEGSENYPVQYAPHTDDQEHRETLYYPVQEDAVPYHPKAVPAALPSFPQEEQEVIHINDVPVYIPEEYRRPSEELPLDGHTVAQEAFLVPTPAHVQKEEPVPTLEGLPEGLQPLENVQGEILAEVEVSDEPQALEGVHEGVQPREDVLGEILVEVSAPEPEPEPEASINDSEIQESNYHYQNEQLEHERANDNSNFLPSDSLYTVEQPRLEAQVDNSESVQVDSLYTNEERAPEVNSNEADLLQSDFHFAKEKNTIDVEDNVSPYQSEQPESEPQSEPEPEPEPEPLQEQRSLDSEEDNGGYDVPHQATSALMAAVNVAQPIDV